MSCYRSGTICKENLHNWKKHLKASVINRCHATYNDYKNADSKPDHFVEILETLNVYVWIWTFDNHYFVFKVTFKQLVHSSEIKGSWST